MKGFKNFIKFYDSVSLKPQITPEVRDFYASNNQNHSQPLRVRIAATHAGKITRNNGFYLPHRMREGAKSFISQYKKPIQLHHDSDRDPIGRVIDSRYVDISQGLRQQWDSKKLTDAARPMSDTLLDAFVQGKLSQKEILSIADQFFIQDNSIAEDPDYQGLGYIELLAEITDPDAIQKVLDGRYLTGSVGASTNSAVCSVCKQDWAGEEGPCDHRPGKLYDKAKCVLIAGELLYDEYSFVNKPADTHSSIIEVNVNNIHDKLVVDDDKTQDNKFSPEIMMIADQDIKSITMKTKVSKNHKHIAYLDEDGDGETSFDSYMEEGEEEHMSHGHTHKVIGFVVQEADGHTHNLMNPFNKMKSSVQEDKIMTFKQAYEILANHADLKDKEDLQDVAKKLIDENQGVDQEGLIKLALTHYAIPVEKETKDFASEPAASEKKEEVKDNAEQPVATPVETLTEDPVKLYFGDSYQEIVGDDAWGSQYAEMMFSLLDGVEEKDKAAAEKMLNDAKLSAEARKKLGPATFCGPDRSFPVPDCAHYTAALRLLGRYKGSGNKDSIRSCVERKGKRMGCTAGDHVQDQANKEVGQFTVDYFDSYGDDDLMSLFKGIKVAIEERNLACVSCEEKVNSEDSSKLQDRLANMQKEIRYLHEDVDNLNRALIDSHKKITETKLQKIKDLRKLMGNKEEVGNISDELKSQSDSEIDKILNDLSGKVDIDKIADRLNSGLANVPNGTVADPTLKLDDNNKKKQVRISKKKLEEVAAKYVELRTNRGLHVADAYLARLKASGELPKEMPVIEDKS